MALSLMFDGDIELNSDISEDDGYQFQLVSTYNRGTPIPVEVTLASFLRDGSIVAHDGYQNREMVLQIRVTAPDTAALAAGEKRLKLATEKRTTLSWTTHDEIGATTVFEVLTSNLVEPEGDDLAEIHNQRTYGLRLVCLPFGRSVGLISDDAGTPPSTGGSVFNSCQSTTGWAAFGQGGGGFWESPSFSVDGTVYSEGTGSIKSLMTYWEPGYTSGTSGASSPSQGTSRDEITGLSVATGTGGYLSVAIRGDSANVTTVEKVWQSTSAGVWVEVPTLAAVQYDANGFVHYVWPVAAGQTIIGLRFQVGQVRPHSAGAPRPYTWYDEFELLPSATTDNQIAKQLTVEGSARTTGSLRIAASGDAVALGQVLAITAPTAALPAGFTPDARRWAVGGTAVADVTALGGSYLSPDASTYSTVDGKPIIDVPVGMLTPGPYAIVALVKAASSPITFGVRAQLRPDGTNVGPTSEVEVSVPTTSTTWQFVTVGTVNLPPLPMQNAGTEARVRLLFKGAAFAEVYMIPAWQSEGRAVADFSIVDCGTGAVSQSGASSSLWIDSPSVEQPRGGWWRGPTSDRLNARSAWPDAKKPGRHSFKPGGLTAFVVSLGAAGPTLTLEYYPSWFGNAAL